MPTIQSQRNLIAKMKLLAVEDLIKDKSLLLIDDSIVRGTQLRETTEFLYQSGAKEVHIRPACPPLVYGCKYLNFSRSSSEMDLITRRVIERLENGNVTDEILQEYTNPDSEKYEKMVDEICKELHFTSLRFNRLDDMLDAVGIDKCKLCTYCWDGRDVYDDICEQIEDKENGEYILLSKFEDDVTFEYHITVMEDDFNLGLLVMKTPEGEYKVDFDNL